MKQRLYQRGKLEYHFITNLALLSSASLICVCAISVSPASCPPATSGNHLDPKRLSVTHPVTLFTNSLSDLLLPPRFSKCGHSAGELVRNSFQAPDRLGSEAWKLGAHKHSLPLGFRCVVKSALLTGHGGSQSSSTQPLLSKRLQCAWLPNLTVVKIVFQQSN